MTSKSDSVPDTETLLRRQFVQAAGAAGVTASLAGCYATGGSSRSSSGSVPAAGAGSGFAYKTPAVSRDQFTHVARNPDQLDEALVQGTPKRPAVVWIPPDAAINYSGRSRRITNAVIASTRTVNHPGGLIYSNSMGGNSSAYRGGPVDGMFEMGPRSRFTGVRLRGPTAQAWDSKWMPGFMEFLADFGQDTVRTVKRHGKRRVVFDEDAAPEISHLL